MKRLFSQFGARLILFLMPLLVLAGVVERTLNHVPSDLAVVRNRFEAKMDQIEVLLIGTSHVHTMDPDSFTLPTGSLAFPGQSAGVSCQLGQKYLPHLPRLKQVIFDVAYFSLGYRIDSKKDPANYFYRHVFGIPGDDPSPMAYLDLRYYSKFALYGRESSLGFLRNEMGSGERVGMLWQKPPGEAQVGDGEEDGLMRAKFHQKLLESGDRSVIQASIEGFIEKAQERGLRFSFISTPVAIFYRRHLSPEAVAAEMSEIESLNRRYGTRYYDFQSDPRFVDADYADSDHLNPSGAAKFAPILEAEVMNLPLDDVPALGDNSNAGRTPAAKSGPPPGK